MAFRGHRDCASDVARAISVAGVAGGFGGAEARRVLYIQGAGNQ